MIPAPLLAIILSPAWAAPAPARGITPEMDRHLMEGVDSIFRMEFDRAESAARKAAELGPEHPAPQFVLAGIAWTRYVYERDQSDPTLLAPFEDKIEEVLRVSERWLKKHPHDPEVLTVLGAAYGISSRLHVVRKEWLSGYFRGRKAIRYTRAAVQADPGYYDAYLGVGMYDYYTDVYPRVVRILAKLVLRGDRLRGIQALRLAAEKGHFSRSTAKILLVEIYTESAFGSQDPGEAMRLMSELRAEYPASAMMHSSELVALYSARRFEDVAAGAKSYLRLVEEGRYNPIETAKGQVILGTALWALGRNAEALAAFRAASEVKLGSGLSRWAVWALIRSGELKDELGQRAEALKDYRAAAAAPDHWHFRRRAADRIAKGWDGGFPGPITPP